jgi:hypothetical protein
MGAPPAPEHVERAAEILGNLPPALREAAREPFGARAVVCALLLDAAPAVRQRQIADLAADPALAAEVARFAPLADAVPAAERMSLLMMALPPLDRLSPAQAADLAARIRTLATASGMATPFAWAAQRVALRRLARSPGAPPRVRLRTLGDAEPECHVLLSTIAWVGGRDQAQAQAALDAGVRSLGLAGPWRVLPRERTGPGPLDAALSRLDEAAPALKARALAACVATAAADARVSPGEAEVIRAVSASFGLPMPPLLA